VNWPDKMLSIIPEAEVLIALEPEELGLRMLPVLKSIPDCEGLTRQTFVSVISRPTLPGQRQAGGVYPAQFSKLIEEALVEAWTWLEGAALLVDHASHGGSYKSLSRRARKLADDPNPQRAFAARRFPKEALHPRIREDVWALYHRGKYDTAVFEAMREVEIAVREAAGFARGEHGVPMIRRAFHKDTGPLTDAEAEEAEKEAVSALFAGAVGSYNNPHSHRHVPMDDADEAAEIVMLANHLLRIVDSRAGPPRR